MYLKKIVVISSMLIGVYACGPDTQADLPSQPSAPPVKTTPALLYSVVDTLPHDTTAFTEGFLFHDNKLLESTGDVEYLPQTRSVIGIADLEKGKLDVKVEIDKDRYFGEGIVVLNNKIYQITYQDQTGFVYDAKSFKKIGQFSYQNKEGWGMTTDGKHIIMSDGTYNLTYLDPNDFSVKKVVAVTENGYGLDRINELEYIKGYIYANVYLTNYIVKIDPASGEVVAKMDLDALGRDVKLKHPLSLEMNGIAYDSISGKVLITGKLWPSIYEIKFEH